MQFLISILCAKTLSALLEGMFFNSEEECCNQAQKLCVLKLNERVGNAFFSVWTVTVQHVS
jgi:hypothetical protein